MMQYADTVSAGKDRPQRQVIDVGLNDMIVGQVTSVGESRLDGVGDIDSYNVGGPEGGSQGDMAAFSAATVQHNFSGKNSLPTGSIQSRNSFS